MKGYKIMSVKIGIIIGSNRDSRVGPAIAKWAYAQLPEDADVDYEIIDLKSWDLPFLNEPQLPATGNYAHRSTKEWSDKIDGLDGFIFVTPEYNHGYPAALKNAIDTLYVEWQKKPVAFVGYGGMGGARAVEQLVPVVAQIGMVPLPSVTLNVIDVWSAVNQTGKVDPAYTRGKAESLEKELVWWAEILKTARLGSAIV